MIYLFTHTVSLMFRLWQDIQPHQQHSAFMSIVFLMLAGKIAQFPHTRASLLGTMARFSCWQKKEKESVQAIFLPLWPAPRTCRPLGSSAFAAADDTNTSYSLFIRQNKGQQNKLVLIFISDERRPLSNMQHEFELQYKASATRPPRSADLAVWMLLRAAYLLLCVQIAAI